MPAWNKRQIVVKALGLSGLAKYDGSDVSPAMLQDGISSLDAMMGEWDSKGVRVGYAQSADSNTADPAQVSGLPPWAIRAVYSNLAVELAGGVGREVLPRTAAIASASWSALNSYLGKPIPYKIPNNMPMGAGFKRQYYTGYFILDATDEELEAGSDAELDFS